MNPPAYDLSPLLAIGVVGTLLALGPLLWFWSRRRHAAPAARLQALALATLFLCFDLVLLGSFTRLSDSGLGCPDWPGCYGHASPVGARGPIASAEAAVPTGAVTQAKAWIEMAHRYSATAIGVLVVVLAALAIAESRRRRISSSPRWAIACVVWILLQGAFGALTVTMKLYPAIVTLHLLGGLGLLCMLALQAESYAPQRLALPAPLRLGLAATAGLVVLQIALGGWVSTNYAVLACRDFPTCQGLWWPVMDPAEAFAWRRPLGLSESGGYLPFAALTAIHMAHRLGAAVVVPAIVALGWRLHASAGASARRWAIALFGIAAWQVASGLANVLLGWPLASAVAHTGGSAALVVALTVLLARSARSPSPAASTWQRSGTPLAS
ncbi:MAG: COX15/CtaA family protein [Pseudomonadota bacterium]|nr:COX15/CtaA family protein [Pseudomonadota bacterium]